MFYTNMQNDSGVVRRVSAVFAPDTMWGSTTGIQAASVGAVLAQTHDAQVGGPTDDTPGSVPVRVPSRLLTIQDGETRATQIQHVSDAAEDGGVLWVHPHAGGYYDKLGVTVSTEGSGDVRGDASWPKISDYGGFSIYFLFIDAGYGLLVSFCGEAGSETVQVHGMADATGARTRHAVLEYDWRAGAVTVFAVKDGTHFRITVQSDDQSAPTSTTSFPIPADAQIGSRVRLCGRSVAGRTQERAVCVVNGSHTPGDVLEVRAVIALAHQADLVIDGAPSSGRISGAAGAVLGRGIYADTGPDDTEARSWSFSTTTQVGLFAPDHAAFWDTGERGSMFGSFGMFRGGLRSEGHVGTYAVGFRMLLSGPASMAIVLHFLDDFETRYLELAQDWEDPRPSEHGATPFDWGETHTYRVLVDWESGVGEVWAGAGTDAVLVATGEAIPLENPNRGASVEIGGDGTVGTAYANGLRLGSLCAWVTPTRVCGGWRDGSDILDAVVGGVLTYDGSARRLALYPLSTGFEEVDAQMGTRRAVVIAFDVRVRAWEISGVQSPDRVRAGALCWVAAGDGQIYSLCVVRKRSGVWIVYLDSSVHPIAHVLADDEPAHVFPRHFVVEQEDVLDVALVLEVLPGDGIYVRREGEDASVISVGWANRGSVRIPAPSGVDLASAWAGIGQDEVGFAADVRLGLVSVSPATSITYTPRLPAYAADGYWDRQVEVLSIEDTSE